MKMTVTLCTFNSTVPNWIENYAYTLYSGNPPPTPPIWPAHDKDQCLCCKRAGSPVLSLFYNLVIAGSEIQMGTGNKFLNFNLIQK